MLMTGMTRTRKSNSMNEDPWNGIPQPDRTRLSTRLIPNVSPSSEVTVCWAIAQGGHRALLITYPKKYQDVPMPKLKTINVYTTRHKGKKNTLIELTASETLQQFKFLCLDVIEVVASTDPFHLSSGIQLCLTKWQYLLRPKREMSLERQKGLIAELLFLERVPMRLFDRTGAVRAWTGPLRSPRDFSFGTTYVEVKSNRGSKNPIVNIASERQLSTNQAERLFLYVVGLDESPNGGLTLTDVVTRLRNQVSEDHIAEGELNMRLAAVGYRDDEDYSGYSWNESVAEYYSVSGGFPRIQASGLPFGIDSVSYEIDLRYCVEYLSPEKEVLEAIGH